MTLLELLDLMKKRIKLVIGLPIVCALLIGELQLDKVCLHNGKWRG